MRTSSEQNTGFVKAERVGLIVVCVVLFGMALGAQGGRFVDGRLFIRDTQTNLMWEKKDTSGGLHDVNRTGSWCEATGDLTAKATLMGSESSSDPALCAAGTSSWIAEVNAEKFGGFSDWRIPTVKELLTIVEKSAKGCGAGGPCIDPIFGPAKAFRYWASDDPRRSSRGTVDFYAGEAQNDFARNQFHIRAVRAAK